MQNLANVIHLINVRKFSSMSTYDLKLFSTNDPVQLAEGLHDYSVDFSASLGSPLVAVEASINILEHPANTGFAFFVRLHACMWGLETVVLVFESALFLSKWIVYCSTAERPSEGSFAAFPQYVCRADHPKQITNSLNGSKT